MLTVIRCIHTEFVEQSTSWDSWIYLICVIRSIYVLVRAAVFLALSPHGWNKFLHDRTWKGRCFKTTSGHVGPWRIWPKVLAVAVFSSTESFHFDDREKMFTFTLIHFSAHSTANIHSVLHRQATNIESNRRSYGESLFAVILSTLQLCFLLVHTLGGNEVSMLTHTYQYKPLQKINRGM